MITQPELKAIKTLRRLGLTKYYRKSIKNYKVICKLLTDMLKKNAFNEIEDVAKEFQLLKKAMTISPVIRLPNFSKPFIMETMEVVKALRQY